MKKPYRLYHGNCLQVMATLPEKSIDIIFARSQLGVEVGLDSNARKNRSGHAMENIVRFFLQDICKTHHFSLLEQVTAQKLHQEWNVSISTEKANRRIDFAIKTPQNIFLLETNFYGGGGSKLKSTAGEYQTDFLRWQADGCKFIWITDGMGWKTTWRPLEDTFHKIDVVLNLEMIEKGILDAHLNS